MSYKEFTFGTLVFATCLPVQLLVTLLFIYQVGNRPVPFWPMLVIHGVFILIYLTFYGLTTEITNDTIILSFGVGLIRKRIKLDNVAGVRTASSPWYYGVGIRMIPGGMLYNIRFNDAVELQLKNSGRIIQIGTDDPAGLKSEIDRRRNA